MTRPLQSGLCYGPYLSARDFVLLALKSALPSSLCCTICTLYIFQRKQTDVSFDLCPNCINPGFIFTLTPSTAVCLFVQAQCPKASYIKGAWKYKWDSDLKYLSWTDMCSTVSERLFLSVSRTTQTLLHQVLLLQLLLWHFMFNTFLEGESFKYVEHQWRGH